jgi:hypothetical protein
MERAMVPPTAASTSDLPIKELNFTMGWFLRKPCKIDALPGTRVTDVRTGNNPKEWNYVTGSASPTRPWPS